LYYLIDGKKLITCWHKEWGVIDSLPIRITKFVRQPSINKRYELIDKSMESDKIPLVIKQEDATYYSDGDRVWKDEYKIYQSLYTFFEDAIPDKEETVDFTFTLLGEVSVIKEPAHLSYDVRKSSWASDGLMKLTDSSIKHQLIDQIIFPSLLLPNQPCSLSSRDTYKIVREYVRTNINPKHAEITSDYDFCFTVVKKIPLSSPETFTVNVNALTKRRPKHEIRYRKDRKVTIFEMTYSPENYSGYTPIQGFAANNQGELKERIDEYCSDLIDYINYPVEDCDFCKGRGVIIKSKKELTTNEKGVQ
jgi:hypothetical protein